MPLFTAQCGTTGSGSQSCSGCSDLSTAVFPGSFDPFHLGHLAVVEWAAAAYDDVLVAVLGNPEKQTGMFPVDERVRFIALATGHLANVRCLPYDGLTGTLAREHHASVIIRSAHKEADMERFLAVLNKFMSGGITTEFAPADPATESVSSTRVRELLATGRLEEATAMVPAPVGAELGTAPRIAAGSGPAHPSRAGYTPGPMTMGRRVRPARVVAVQDAPVFLDRDATLDRALGLIEKAAADGADIVTLPESFIPGYPEWAGRTVPGDAPAGDLYATLFDNGVVTGSAVTQVLGIAAQRYGIYLSIGVTERESIGSTLYSTQLLFGPDRELLSARRKAALLGPERLVWGRGDGSPPEVVDTPFGRIGTLIGSENYMPQLRAELYAQGVDIYLAPGWDMPEPWPATLRHIAYEGSVFVVATLTLPGGTVVIGPAGAPVAGPLEGRAGMVAVDIDPNEARHHRSRFA